VGLGVKLSSLLALNTATIQRSELKLKSNLKIDNLVKSVVKSDTLIKTAQLPAQKTSPALKTQLKSILDVGLDAPLINIPTFKNPPITPPRVPIKPNIPLVLWLDHQKVKKKKKKSDISGLDKLYLPDFTSRSLGLTQKVSEKNLMAKINKMQSGLEIRRGITTKKKKNVGFKLPKEIKIKW